AATSLLSAGQASMPLCLLTPRRSPLRALSEHQGVQVLASMETLAGDLTDALASATGPLAIVVDDAELLLDTPASARLDRIVRTAGDHDWPILGGGQSRSGILLQPSSVADGEVLDVRLPRSTGTGHAPPPGRGILALRGKWTNIQ